MDCGECECIGLRYPSNVGHHCNGSPITWVIGKLLCPYNGPRFVQIMDEIHLLGEERGPVLEVIVSRMRYIAASAAKKNGNGQRQVKNYKRGERFHPPDKFE